MRAENRTPARKPLDAAALRRAALRPGGLWRDVEVAARTGSTNADLLAPALRGGPEGAALAAAEPSAGRGRMGRSRGAPPAGSRGGAGRGPGEGDALLRGLGAGCGRWYGAGGGGGGARAGGGRRAESPRLSGTIGRLVRAELPGGQALSGSAVGVNPD